MEVFPVIVGKLGTWTFYSTRMKPRALVRNVQFANELWPDSPIEEALQRTLNLGRAKVGIAKYLSLTPDRFFNSIVIAAMGGQPKFFGLNLADDPTMRIMDGPDVNGAIGVLKFESTVKYYALDGQHRLKAISALLNGETDFAVPNGFENEEFPVLVVVQKGNESDIDFKIKYRRLFGNLNRWAKPVDQATNILLDEDDMFAILTRRLMRDHIFFKKIKDSGIDRIRYEGAKHINDGESIFSTLICLYEFNKEVLSSPLRRGDLDGLMKFRIDEEELDKYGKQLTSIWDIIIEQIEGLKSSGTTMRTSSIEPVTVDGQECVSHLWFRPIGLEVMGKLIRGLLDMLNDPENPNQDEITSALNKINKLPRLLSDAPFKNLLFVPVMDMHGHIAKWKMRSEERKEAIQKSLEVLRYITGIMPHDEGQLLTLKNGWKSTLKDATDENVKAMWDQIRSYQKNYNND